MEAATVTPIKIEDELQSSYLDYAMSVIISRALPDVRDGLKPVQRRIMYAMDGLGLRFNTPYRKSARIVGEVLGKYHPHGDAPVYDAMVRLAQDFSMRYTLVDGQGNFGSIDDDPPAAMRYTEARLARIAEEMLADIDQDTVDFVANFDGSINEPTVLPAKLPNLLLNGASGIAVGMATSIPPHNLGELCDALCYLIDNPEATIEDLIPLVPGPDFPTGGLILGRAGIRSAYTTGHGKIVVRAQSQIEEVAKGRHRIIVTELPYQTNKASLVERIATLVKNKKLDGIAELRDESNREGIRIVIELKRDGQPQQVLNNLYKHTAMQSAFFTNMLALVDAQPRVINLKTALQHYINFRRQLLTRKSQFELRKAREREHILEGLKIALDHLDEVITTIRSSENAEKAQANLMKQYGLSQAQAQAILEMQLRRLSALERDKVTTGLDEVLKTISYLEDLLANPRKVDFTIKGEIEELKSRHRDPRRTQISDEEAEEFSIEDLVPHQQMAVILTQRGYIKRVPSESFRSQHRGGKGVTGMATREADAVQHLVIADTHDSLLLFTNRGRVFQVKCHRLPQESSRQAKGIPIINLIPIDTNEQITAVIATAYQDDRQFIVMATRHGQIKRSRIHRFASVRHSGIIAMSLKPEDEMVGARAVSDEDDVMLLTRGGRSIRFPISQLRIASRTSGGVRGIALSADDMVVGTAVPTADSFLLTLTANGFGKKTPFHLHRRQRRGGAGIKAHGLHSKTGPLVAAAATRAWRELLIMSQEGVVIRITIDDVPRQGRASRGAHLMRLGEGDEVASVACLADDRD